MKYEYSDTVSLHDEMTIGTTRSLEEFFRGIGWLDTRYTSDQPLRFGFPAESEWDACMLACEVATQLASYGIQYEPSKAHLKEMS